ncbi:isomerase [Rhodobacteraceae bacterium CCMM004]|nr:isomerase [Rhodobacteraceae bacterium CCMM004]
MTTFSANLGFLWADRPLPEAIRAAAAAGFAAVECHWPYDVPAAAIHAALAETGLPMLSLNTLPGGPGKRGLSALPGRGDEARAAIDRAVAYAAAVGCAQVHVMAGTAQGPAAEAAFVEALHYACDRAAPHGIGVLIEPLNPYDAPGYFLSGTAQAERLIARCGRANLALMLDCYHVQILDGDLSRRIAALLPITGHVQFAGVPDRGPPDRGEVAYGHVFALFDRLGWERPLGAEYRPGGDTDASLGWMRGLVG